MAEVTHGQRDVLKVSMLNTEWIASQGNLCLETRKHAGTSLPGEVEIRGQAAKGCGAAQCAQTMSSGNITLYAGMSSKGRPQQCWDGFPLGKPSVEAGIPGVGIWLAACFPN